MCILYIVQICTLLKWQEKKNSSYSPYQTAPPPDLSLRSPRLGGILQWLSSSSCKCRLGCTVVYTSGYMPPVLVVQVQWWPSAHRSNLWRYLVLGNSKITRQSWWSLTYAKSYYYKIFPKTRNVLETYNVCADLWQNWNESTFFQGFTEFLADNILFSMSRVV